MKKKYFIPVFFAMAQSLFAAAPFVQRIDVVNLLGFAGSTQTSVVLSFSNGTKPCYTVTLPFQGAATVWIGTGQACTTPVFNVSITPVAQPGGGMLYSTPDYPVEVDITRYSTLLTVSQNMPPMFDPTNGALIYPGSIQTLVETH